MCGLRSLRVILDNCGGYIFRNSEGETEATQNIKQYKKEHCATQLEIELNDELRNENIDYYRLVFNMGSTLENRFDSKITSIKITADSNPYYVADGVIYFILPDSLTAMSSLLVQVEAFTASEEESTHAIMKSVAFELVFERSVEGAAADIPESENSFGEKFDKALESMNKAIEELDKLMDTVNNSLDNGDFNGSDATINGYNAVEITGGENISVTQQDDKIIIDDKHTRHTHSNQKSLDGLYCEDAESEIVSGTDSHYLKFNSSALRYVSDGAVVKRVSEVEKDGQSYLRLWLYDGRSLIVSGEIPDYIDIPVSAVISTESADDDGLILNGSELELGSGATNAEIAEIRTAIDEIKGGIDEIETMIDESGVLE